MEKNEIIKTERLTLKNISEKDIKKFLELLNDSEIKKTYMIPDFKDDNDGVNFCKKIIEICNDKKRLFYGIYLEDEIIGFMNDVVQENDSVEAGYFIDTKQQHHGYATEALKAFISECFSLGFKSVTAGYFEGNNASEKVMIKSKMHKINKTELIEYRGLKRNCFYYEILKEEWETNYEKI